MMLLKLVFPVLLIGLSSASHINSTTTTIQPGPSTILSSTRSQTTPTQIFYLFHTNFLPPNIPIPTLHGQIQSVDDFGFTQYQINCLPKDAPAGCTYTNFIVSASATSQLYYETTGLKRSVGCELHNSTLAVCSSRTHGEDRNSAARQTMAGTRFPGYYPVLVTAMPIPKAYQGANEMDTYIYEDPPQSSAAGRHLQPMYWEWSVGCILAIYLTLAVLL
ncbi:hypothetical protein TWF694_000552 [Orbilia ellipsospora]|uniref:Uncharacterized protein n=1 Tax=Orbilia ellipsospora TaxID=2528407 RepID=A0AAV9XQF8_9PEZI